MQFHQKYKHYNITTNLEYGLENSQQINAICTIITNKWQNILCQWSMWLKANI